MTTRRRTKHCPQCGGKPELVNYVPDSEQIDWGYPQWFRICATCWCPLVEVGDGHCKGFKRKAATK